jgi:hypothetical protein
MPRDYTKKLEQMRVNSKTPAGRAAQQRSRDNFVIKRREASAPAKSKFKVNAQPLVLALANWR